MDETIRRLLLAAGDILRSGFRERVAWHEKERYHLVTEADNEIARLLVEGLHQAYPDDTVDTEETPPEKRRTGTRWIIDPLDGTTNFIMGDPFFAVSIAREQDGCITEGYVYCPMGDELYTAQEGAEHALLNGEPIRVSGTARLEDALVAYGFSARMSAIERYHAEWRHVWDTSGKGVAWIAPAPALCNLARGRIDIFIDYGAEPHGHAAAAFIVGKAGGIVYGYGLDRYDHRARGVVACSPLLAEELRASRKAGPPTG